MWFKGLSTPIRHDDRVVFDGIMLDITEQKLAEEKSRQSEEKFTKVFMTTPDCIVITRLKDGKIMDVNRGFEEISGWKTQEVIGRTAKEIKVWNDLVERDKMVNDLKAGSDVRNRESRFRRKDGSLRNVIYSARNINIAGDDCIIFVLQDITNLKEAERSLRSSLEEKELLIKELYHGPRTICRSQRLALLKSAGTDDQKHDLFTDIETRIQTMALVHQKLYESQNLTDINLHDLINSFAELSNRNYALVPEKMSIKQSVGSILISIDVAMPLSLVLNELISNSLKHAFPGGSSGEILIKIESIGENLKFEYRDNGIGLPEGFEPSASSTLGMNIMHTISKNQLGGEIIFEGIRVYNQYKNQPLSKKDMMSAKKKLMIVEDEMITAMSLRHELMHLGYEVTEIIATGDEAVKKAFVDMPSTILMDINLIGEMDGIQAIQKIHEQMPIPVIYMTGYSTKEIKDRALKTALAYLKPVSIQHIRKILECQC